MKPLWESPSETRKAEARGSRVAHQLGNGCGSAIDRAILGRVASRRSSRCLTRASPGRSSHDKSGGCSWVTSASGWLPSIRASSRRPQCPVPGARCPVPGAHAQNDRSVTTLWCRSPHGRSVRARISRPIPCRGGAHKKPLWPRLTATVRSIKIARGGGRTDSLRGPRGDIRRNFSRRLSWAFGRFRGAVSESVFPWLCSASALDPLLVHARIGGCVSDRLTFRHFGMASLFRGRERGGRAARGTHASILQRGKWIS